MTFTTSSEQSGAAPAKSGSEYHLVQKLGTAVVASEWKYLRTLLVEIKTERFNEVMDNLKDEGITHLSTIIGLESDRGIEILYPFFTNVKDSEKADKLMIKVILPKEKPEIDSLVSRFWGAQFYEREVFDILGVNFRGHPNLERLIMPDIMPMGVHPLLKKWTPEQLQEMLEEAQRQAEEKGRHGW
ncbi:MAG: NADH-quinone oxidoreductase subunit C [Candidatus Heimdallarchaeota archaeon]